MQIFDKLGTRKTIYDLSYINLHKYIYIYITALVIYHRNRTNVGNSKQTISATMKRRYGSGMMKKNYTTYEKNKNPCSQHMDTNICPIMSCKRKRW